MGNPDDITLGRLLKLTISAGVYALTVFRTFSGRAIGKAAKGSGVVLYYHSVPPNEQTRFARQLDILLANAAPIKSDGTALPNRNCVAVTFDDAFENFVSTALPELQQRQIPATLFVITRALGKTFGPSEHPERIISLQQLKALPADLITVGSHTATHPMLTRVSEEESRKEIVESRKDLESLLQREVRLFSFPFGDFDGRLCQVCRDAGYQRIFTTLPILGLAGPGEFVVGRVRVDPTDWPVEFRLKLAGAYRWLPLAFRIKRSILSWWPLRIGAGSAGRKGTLHQAESLSMIHDRTQR